MSIAVYRNSSFYVPPCTSSIYISLPVSRSSSSPATRNRLVVVFLLVLLDRRRKTRHVLQLHVATNLVARLAGEVCRLRATVLALANFGELRFLEDLGDADGERRTVEGFVDAVGIGTVSQGRRGGRDVEKRREGRKGNETERTHPSSVFPRTSNMKSQPKMTPRAVKPPYLQRLFRQRSGGARAGEEWRTNMKYGP